MRQMPAWAPHPSGDHDMSAKTGAAWIRAKELTESGNTHAANHRVIYSRTLKRRATRSQGGDSKEVVVSLHIRTGQPQYPPIGSNLNSVCRLYQKATPVPLCNW